MKSEGWIDEFGLLYAAPNLVSPIVRSLLPSTMERELKPDILGLSGLLTACAPSIKETIALVRQKVGDKLKIIVGGGAVNRKVAMEYGADDYTDDCVKGLEIMKSWAKQNA